MSKKKEPIMSADAERFMAFEGLVQWTAATVAQGKRLAEGRAQFPEALRGDVNTRRLVVTQMQCEYHYFAIAANKVLEHRRWALTFGLCANVDFRELDEFSESDIRDLRNMREHVIDYFQGIGRDKTRWEVETPEFKADASSVIGTMIGGRLDWARFTAVAERLLPVLLAEPVPYPPAS